MCTVNKVTFNAKELNSDNQGNINIEASQMIAYNDSFKVEIDLTPQ
jgi:hypothetical protein